MQLQDTDTVAPLLGRVLQDMDKESRTILYSKLISMLCVSVSYTNRVAVEIGIRRVDHDIKWNGGEVTTVVDCEYDLYGRWCIWHKIELYA